MNPHSLSYEWVRGLGGGSLVLVFLHGIMGQKRNWLYFARQLVKAHPHMSALLIDLRNHGDSQEFPPPHTLDACAKDIEALLEDQQLKRPVLVGHSFGGKVALKVLERNRSQLGAVVILDALPVALSGARDEMIQRLLSVLQERPHFADRNQYFAWMQERGVPRGIAEWMGQNLKADSTGYSLGLNYDAIEAMMTDFEQTSFMHFLSGYQRDAPIFFVRAEKNTKWSQALWQDLERLAELGHVKLATLNAGHWLHVDNPAGLLELFGEFGFGSGD